jgi:hypothetical protein
MYPFSRLARSTTSDQKTKWWFDDEEEEKPGVTPTDDHLAKRPVKTHIYSREEMEAFAEEKLRYVLDIDEKKDFLDQVFPRRSIMQNSRKEPFHSDCSYRPYPTATKSWSTFPVWLIVALSSKWILNMNHGTSSQYVWIRTSSTPSAN